MTRMLLRRSLHLSLLFAAAACGSDGGGIVDPVTPTPVEPNFVRLQSDPGDFIGQGGTYEYSQADAVFGLSVAPGRLSVTVDGDERWRGDFQLPAGDTRLVPGTYAGLQRYPFHDPIAGGLSWSGGARGCNTLTGSFTIDSVRYEGASLAAIALHFEQHCEGVSSAIRGSIRWRSDDPTRPPGPVAPPAGLWRPAQGAVPSSGNVVHLSSTAGDYIGGGSTFTYAGAFGSVSLSGTLLTISAQGWDGRFQGMNVISQLQTGYYGQLGRWPFHNATRGGLSWSGQGRACNRLHGWFVIDRITYTGGQLTAVELRFEQRCESPTAPPLYGYVRWSQ